MNFFNGMLTELDRVIDRLRAAECEHRTAIDAVAPTHRDGARNLVHYNALRNVDMRTLQAGLASVGATRLSTTEPAVLPRLYAAHNVLDLYAGRQPVYGSKDVAQAFARADDILEEHADALFGATSEETHSRIMVTLPREAADDYQLVKGFAEAGMELARINCAHDGPEVWRAMIDHVRAAAEEFGREIRVSMDLAGPKVRTGAIEPGPAVARARVTRNEFGEVIAPAKLYISALGAAVPPPPGEPGRAGLSVQVEPAWAASLAVGAEITLRDARGKRRGFTVQRVGEDGLVVAHGVKNTYVADTTRLECAGASTQVWGIEPAPRALHLREGDTLILTTSQAPARPGLPGETATIGCTAPEAVAALKVGHAVLFDDGSIAAKVIETRSAGGESEALLRVTRAKESGTKLAAYKGINLPDTAIPLPSLTAEDLAAFEFVAHHGDIAAISFIRTPQDVREVLGHLEDFAERAGDKAERVRNLGIVLKIETVPAYEQLAGVLLEGMRHPNLGIMIARGDLAVELGFERMAEVPRLISQLAEAAHVPVIMATQILENLAKSGLPSRAEITDAAYALRAECVMLNKGPHITDAIRILEKMSAKLGRSQRKNRQMLRQISSWSHAV